MPGEVSSPGFSKNVTQAVSEEGLTYEFAYDEYGNNTSVSIVSDGTKITSSATYSNNGNTLATATDALGNVTIYDYDAETGVLNWVQYPGDTDASRTTYSYDEMYRMASAAATTDTGTTLSAVYTYTNDLLTKIQTGSTAYTFTYGSFGLRTGAKVGSRTLASYSYTDDQNKYLETLAYGNGDGVQYTYDDKGRVLTQTYEDGSAVTYSYDNDGALAAVTDSETGITTTYYYDFTDRLMQYVEGGTNYSHSVGYTYDTLNNLTALVETINGVEHTTSYAYDDDNRITSVTNGSAVKSYTYDAFGRSNTQTTANGDTTVKTDTFTFNAPSASATSGQISGHTIDLNGTDNDKTYTYTYDDNGNIISISDGANTISYEYDSANQLVRENNQAGNYTHTWTYDSAGNILERKEYAYTTGELGAVTDTVTYAYEDTQGWGDLLTAYDGQAITYDEIGNPLNDGTWMYTWKHGRQLASMTDGSTTWSYTYNADGLRTSKTDGKTYYSYVYSGDKLTYMTAGNKHMYFAYDANGTPMSIVYSGTVYYYVTNVQGDVIALVDSEGKEVVTYTYDAWGNPLSMDGDLKETLGKDNPLRYRSYVYDQETGLYYLQSRYYNPEVGRFINADNYPTTGQGLTGNNMFAYCGNNPISREDDGGEFWNIVIGAAVGAVVSAVTTAIDTYVTTGSIDWGKVGISAAVGAISGGVAATGLGAIAQAGITAGVTAVGEVASQTLCEGKKLSQIDTDKVIHNSLLAGGTSLLGSALGGITSMGYSNAGKTLVSAGKDKLLTGYVRQNAGQSYSYLMKQGQKLIATGTRYINTGRGVSSVTGTLFTWAFAWKYSK